MIDLADLVKTWNEIEAEYKEKYIDKTPDDDMVSYIELCNYIDFLLKDKKLRKKKSLLKIKEHFAPKKG